MHVLPCRRHKRHRFDHRAGKILWRRAWHTTPVFSPGKFHGQSHLADYSPWVAKNWAQLKQFSATELVMSFGGSTFLISKGNQGVTELSKASNRKQKYEHKAKKMRRKPKGKRQCRKQKKTFLKSTV